MVSPFPSKEKNSLVVFCLDLNGAGHVKIPTRKPRKDSRAQADMSAEEAKAAEAEVKGEDVKTGAVEDEGPVEVDPNIKKQVEFYFSDSNLPKDKFLRLQVGKTPEGWVSLKTISEFKKMKDMNCTVKKLAAAAKASDFLAVDEKEENVRRTTPLPDTDVTLPSSIFAEKFPAETTIEDLHAFFVTYAPILSVRLVKPPVSSKESKKSKESKEGEAKEGEAKEGETKVGEAKIGAFIEFDTAESAKKVAEQEILYKEEKLSMKPKEEYLKELPSSTTAGKGNDSKKRGRESFGGDGKDGDQKREKRDRGGKDNHKKEGDKKEDMEANYKAYPKGVFVNVKGVGEGCTMQAIKDIYAQYGNVKFVEFREGQTDACVRFEGRKRRQKP